MAILKLRDYQEEAVNSLLNYWSKGGKGNPLVIAPTAAGKSIIIADFCKRVINSYPDSRLLVVTHNKELIEQNEAELLEYWSDAPTGVYSASVKRKEKDRAITFAGIQSIYKKAFDFEPFDLIIVDECHMIPHKDSGMYRTFFKDCKLVNPHVKVIGLTASPFRLDNGSLIEGDGKIFDGIAYNITVKKLLNDGYLCPLTAREGIAHLETKLLKTSGGDYSASSQIEAFSKDDLTGKALSEIIKLGADRKSWMIFCANVKHAQEVSDRLNDMGIDSACVHGLSKDRDEIIEDFKNYKYRCLVSVNILTTGFNVKQVDLIALMRSTKSASLYYQILGRGMRLHPSKKDCLVLDYGENILNHGAVDEIVERQLAKGAKKKGKKGQPVMKRCEKCGFLAYASVRQCPDCGQYFPINTLPKIQQQAARLAVLSIERELKRQVLEVDKVFYSIHKKQGKPDSLKITYKCGIILVNEWLLLEHHGRIKDKSRDLWFKMVGTTWPSDTELTTKNAYNHATSIGTMIPKSITVENSGKYFQVIDRHDLHWPDTTPF